MWGERPCPSRQLIADRAARTPESELLSKNFVHLVSHMLAAGRLQVSHCALHVRVAEPLLHCSQINTSGKSSGSGWLSTPQSLPTRTPAQYRLAGVDVCLSARGSMRMSSWERAGSLSLKV